MIKVTMQKCLLMELGIIAVRFMHKASQIKMIAKMCIKGFIQDGEL